MSRTFLTIYLGAPPVVVVVLGAVDGQLSLSLDSLVVEAINCVLLSLPQLSWLGLARLIRASPVREHSGFIGATAALLGMFLLELMVPAKTGAFLWLFYYPTAAALMAAFFAATFIFFRNRPPSAQQRAPADGPRAARSARG